MKRIIHFVTAALTINLLLLVSDVGAQTKVSYYKEIRPILRTRCQGCHQPANQGGKLVLTSYEAFRAGGASGASFVPGRPQDSSIMRFIGGTAPSMPKNQKPLTSIQVETITRWIAEGATNDTPDIESLQNDAALLVKTWQLILDRAQNQTKPCLLYKDQHTVLNAIRDLAPRSRVVIEGSEAYSTLQPLIKEFAPDLHVMHYKRKASLFDLHNLEEKIATLHKQEIKKGLNKGSGRATQVRPASAEVCSTKVGVSFDPCT